MSNDVVVLKTNDQLQTSGGTTVLIVQGGQAQGRPWWKWYLICYVAWVVLYIIYYIYALIAVGTACYLRWTGVDYETGIYYYLEVCGSSDYCEKLEDTGDNSIHENCGDDDRYENPNWVGEYTYYFEYLEEKYPEYFKKKYGEYVDEETGEVETEEIEQNFEEQSVEEAQERYEAANEKIEEAEAEAEEEGEGEEGTEEGETGTETGEGGTETEGGEGGEGGEEGGEGGQPEQIEGKGELPAAGEIVNPFETLTVEQTKALINACSIQEEHSLTGQFSCTSNSQCRGFRTCIEHNGQGACFGEHYCPWSTADLNLFAQSCIKSADRERGDGSCTDGTNCLGRRKCENGMCTGESFCPSAN